MPSLKQFATASLMSDSIENTDLRNQDTNEPRALRSTYGRHDQPEEKVTTELPFGTQSKFIEAAKVAARLGLPLNTLLTVRWLDLLISNQCIRLRDSDAPERIRRTVELIRKWIRRRTGRSFAYVWAREETAESGEHWHIALHLPKQLEKAFAIYIAQILGECMALHPRPASKRTKGEWACGESGSWHIARDTFPEREGYYLAAYLGKGEASSRLFRGTLVTNKKKAVRGGKYDIRQGEIRGTVARTTRFDIALPLKKMLKRACQ